MHKNNALFTTNGLDYALRAIANAKEMVPKNRRPNAHWTVESPDSEISMVPMEC
jgi:hypothetical protein